MKIDPNKSVQPPEFLRKRGGAAGSDAAGKTAAAGDAFVVELSSKIGRIADPRDDAEREARVAEIRAQLASGNYNISGKDVASKMLGLLKG